MDEAKTVTTGIKVPWRDRIGYFCSDFGHQGVMWNFINAYFLYYLTDILKIGVGAAGVLLLIVTIFDAVNDPIIGAWVDRTKTKLGTYRPYVIFGAIPMGLMTFLCFVCPKFSVGGRLAWAYIMYALFTVAGTYTGCAFGAMPAVMTDDPNQRVILGTCRDWGANLGGFLYNLVAVTLLTKFSGSDIPTARGYGLLALCVGCWVAIMLLLCGFNCRERIDREEGTKEPFLKSIGSVFKNRPAMCLILMVICINCFLAFKATLTTYYTIHYLGDLKWMTLIMTLQFTTPVVLEPAVPFMVKALGKKKMFIFSGCCAILSGALLLIAQRHIWLICVAALCCGLVVTGVFATIWGTMPDCADYGLWKTGVYCPGIMCAMATFSTKLGSGIAQYGGAAVLKLAGYDPDAEVQTARAINAMWLTNGIAPMVLGALAICCVLPFNLTNEKLAQINKELAEREAK